MLHIVPEMGVPQDLRSNFSLHVIAKLLFCKA